MNTLRLASRLSITAFGSRRPRAGAWRLLLPLAFGLQLACSGRGGPEEKTADSSDRGKGGVVLKEGDRQVDILIDGKPFTSYHFQGYNKPIFFPLRSATGTVVTRGFPMIEDIPGESRDHRHHTGVWFTHGDVNGVDFWSETPECGTIRHQRFERVESGAEVGVLKSLNHWLTRAGELVLTETREVRIYNRPESRIMDLEVELTAAGGPVKFGDTKEGSFGMRLAGPFTEKEGLLIRNSEGARGEAGCWGKPARWVDYTTRVGSETLGVAILDHPGSFRHPTHWHARGYSLFAANPFGLHDFYGDDTRDGSYLLPAGETVRFHYRVYIHSGDADLAGVEQEFQAFAQGEGKE